MARNDRVRGWLTPEVVVVLLFVLAAGNPWVADKIINASINTTSSLPGYLYYLLRFPAWRLSTGRSVPNLHDVIGSDLQVFFLVVVTAILSRRLANSSTAGLARSLSAIGTVVLAAAIAAVVGGFVTAPGLGSSTLTGDGGTGGFVLGTVSQGVFFSALVGLVAAAVIMGRGDAWRNSPAGSPRQVNRGDGVNMPAWSPGGGAKDDVTRYLCMAARTDERFAEQVVDEVLAEETRAVAYSVGVDLNPVLRHCLAAWRQHQQRDVVLAVVFTVTLVIAPFWTLIGTLCLLLAARAARITLARQPTQRQMRYLSPPRGVVVAVALLASLVLAFVIRAAIGSVTGLAAWLLGPVWLGVFILFGLAVMYGLIARDKLLTHHTLVSKLRRAVFSPEAAPPAGNGQLWIPPRLAAIAEAVGGNVTVYSGYEPFVGFGSTIDGWTFAVPLLPATNPQGLSAARRDIVPFTTVELIDRVRGRLQSALDLGSGEPNGQGADHLDALILEDRVFVNGSALVTEGLPLLPQPGQMPGNRLSPEEIERIALHPRGAVRHYLCAHVPSWGGEIMASTFLHMSTAGDVLYLHCDRRVVGPVTTAYHDVDRMTETMTPGQRLRLLAEAVAELPGMAFGCYRRAVHRGLLEWRHDRRLLRDITCAEEDLAFDYGARVSVRQLAIDPHFQNYFQVVDAIKHFSIVTRHVLAATRDFLEEHGVDTTEFRAQQMTVLNQGIIQSGGISLVGSQAVGAGAQATQSNQAMPANQGTPTNQAAMQEPAASG